MLSSVRPVYAFGPFLLDPAERQLFRDGQPVPVLPKSLDVLILLVERPGQLVTKEALLAAVWAETVVEENALSVTISRLRTVLEDRGRQGRYIETVTGHGYRFIASVSERWHVGGGGDSIPPTETVVAVQPARASASSTPFRDRWDGWTRVGLAVVGCLAILGGLLPWLHSQTPAPGPSPVVAAADIAGPSGELPAAALEAYRRGRATWASRRGEAMLHALTDFKLAARLDSTLALAYLGQAQVYATSYQMEAEAEIAITRALTLDPTLGEAWGTRGFVRGFQAWDWIGAEAAFDRALELDPVNITTLQWLASLRMVQRRLSEAEALLRQALELEPDYVPLHADLCEVLYYRRRYDAARAACDHAIVLDPGHPFALRHRPWIALAAGRYAEAARLFHDVYPMRAGSSAIDPGDKAAFERFLRLHAQHYAFDDAHLARVYAALGEPAAAMTHIERAVNERAFLTPFLHPDPLFDPLRDDPRWQAAMQQMGISQ